MVLTYFWISGSKHPLFIHLVRPENFLIRFNLSFMTALTCVPLPIVYTLGYIGLIMGHLVIRALI